MTLVQVEDPFGIRSLTISNNRCVMHLSYECICLLAGEQVENKVEFILPIKYSNSFQSNVYLSAAIEANQTYKKALELLVIKRIGKFYIQLDNNIHPKTIKFSLSGCSVFNVLNSGTPVKCTLRENVYTINEEVFGNTLEVLVDSNTGSLCAAILV